MNRLTFFKSILGIGVASKVDTTPKQSNIQVTGVIKGSDIWLIHKRTEFQRNLTTR